MKNNDATQEIAVLSLINKHFWKSKVGPITALAIPLFLMIVYKIIGKDEIEVFTGGLPSYFSFSILPLGFISLPQMLVEFKTSIILRKISTSKVTAIKFCTIMLAYNFVAILSANILIILFYAMFLNVDAPDAFATINWWELLYALFNVYISTLSFGLLLGVLINRNNLVQSIGFCFVIVSITFSGQFIPISVLYRSGAMQYISLISPTSYSLNLMNVVLLPSNSEGILKLFEQEIAGKPLVTIIEDSNYNTEELKAKLEDLKNYRFNGIFDIKNDFKIFTLNVIESNIEIPGTNEKFLIATKLTESTIYRPWQNILDLIMPYVLTIIFLFVSIKKFKWTSR